MRRSIRLILALALAVAACAGDAANGAIGATTTPAATEGSEQAMEPAATTVPPASPTTADSATAAGFPATVDIDGGAVTIAERPSRIAALSATHVEMLYAMGAGEQLVAGDLFSTYPAEAASLEQLDSFNLSVESVIALDPDLVILSFDPVDAVAALEAVGIPTLLLGTAPDLDAVYEQIATLGTATGNAEAADGLNASIRSNIEEIVSTVDDAAAGRTYYHETDPFSFYTPNSSSFIGKLYALVGMENIADAAPDDLSSGFPQLSPEFIITADPEFVFLAGVGETPETLADREGWDTLSALEADRVFVLDPDAASRWGPRIVDLLRAIGDAVIGAGS